MGIQAPYKGMKYGINHIDNAKITFDSVLSTGTDNYVLRHPIDDVYTIVVNLNELANNPENADWLVSRLQQFEFNGVKPFENEDWATFVIVSPDVDDRGHIAARLTPGQYIDYIPQDAYLFDDFPGAKSLANWLSDDIYKDYMTEDNESYIYNKVNQEFEQGYNPYGVKTLKDLSCSLNRFIDNIYASEMTNHSTNLSYREWYNQDSVRHAYINAVREGSDNSLLLERRQLELERYEDLSLNGVLNKTVSKIERLDADDFVPPDLSDYSNTDFSL